MTSGLKRVLAPAIVAGALALAATTCHAELVERGDLFARFSGGIAPNALPRHLLAPIAVSVSGTVKTLSGARPPALRQIVIAINRGGKLDPHGLPVCHRHEIEPSSSRQALEACGDALVGEGSYAADVAFPEQLSFPSQGRILAFNAVVDGHTAILAHVYGGRPVPITRIIVFRVRRTRGTYGTVLSGELPASLNRYGYVKRISLRLHRRFTYRGRPRSYLSASCAAPSGFTKAVFPFARASMTFADGRTLESKLSRTCGVAR